MTKHVRINIKTAVNASKIRKEKRNGRDVVIVPSATLPDDVVMNNIMYPAAEIEKGYKTLERTPAPFGHPMINDMFVSARDPEGLNLGYIGAWNENVRRDNGRVFMDKVIDVEVASRSENGKRVLNAIEKGEAIHTSTGLLANIDEAPEGSEYKHVARDMEFDHDAILLDEVGAATPDQGVGMLVNGKQVDVINSSIEDRLDESLDWALDSIARTMEQKQRMPMVERLKQMIIEAFSTDQPHQQNKEPETMADDNKAFDARLNALETTVNNVNTAIEGLGTTLMEALKPLSDQVATLTNAQNAQLEAEKTKMVNKVVESGILSEAAANSLTNEALTELVTKIQPGKGQALNAAFQGNKEEKSEFADYDFNAIIDGEKK